MAMNGFDLSYLVLFVFFEKLFYAKEEKQAKTRKNHDFA